MKEVDVIVSSVISIRGLGPTDQAVLRRRYTFFPTMPPGTPSHVRPTPVCLAKSFHDFLVVPRDMRLLTEMPTPSRIVDAQDPLCESFGEKLAFKGFLDSSRNQTEAVEKCMAMLKAHPMGGGCLLSLPPGFGKTACALYISSQIARRTLILVHTSVLADQWRDRVLAFLENATPVMVTSQKIPDNFDGATHVIVLLQTIVAQTKRGATAWLENLHDLVIVDECHHICARTLCRVVEAAGARYRLGLSATIARRDGLDTMLECLLGPVAYQCERHDHPNLTVQVLRYKSTKTCHVGLSFVDSINRVAADKDRLKIVMQKIVSLYTEENRHIIVLSDRLGQLYDIRRALAEDHAIPHHMAIGGNKGSPDLATRPVILATYQFASEGLDIPILDTCVMASPRVEVKQSVGRILRSPGGNPLVVDIVDEDMPILRRQFGKRKRFYTSALADGGLDAVIVG